MYRIKDGVRQVVFVQSFRSNGSSSRSFLNTRIEFRSGHPVKGKVTDDPFSPRTPQQCHGQKSTSILHSDFRIRSYSIKCLMIVVDPEFKTRQDLISWVSLECVNLKSFPVSPGLPLRVEVRHKLLSFCWCTKL